MRLPLHDLKWIVLVLCCNVMLLTFWTLNVAQLTGKKTHEEEQIRSCIKKLKCRTEQTLSEWLQCLHLECNIICNLIESGPQHVTDVNVIDWDALKSNTVILISMQLPEVKYDEPIEWSMSTRSQQTLCILLWKKNLPTTCRSKFHKVHANYKLLLFLKESVLVVEQTIVFVFPHLCCGLAWSVSFNE